MSAISVLHSESDGALGEKIADTLKKGGHSAHAVASGSPQEPELPDSDAAIVIWSQAAMKLARLHDQAREALARGALIPVAVGGAPAPIGFEEVPPVDLSGWVGDENDPRWRFVLEEINLATRTRILEDNDLWATAEREENEAENLDGQQDFLADTGGDFQQTSSDDEIQQGDLEIAQTPAPAPVQASPSNLIASARVKYSGAAAPVYKFDFDEADATPKSGSRFSPVYVTAGGAVVLAAITAVAAFLAPTLIFSGDQPAPVERAAVEAPVEGIVAAIDAPADAAPQDLPTVNLGVVQPAEDRAATDATDGAALLASAARTAPDMATAETPSTDNIEGLAAPADEPASITSEPELADASHELAAQANLEAADASATDEPIETVVDETETAIASAKDSDAVGDLIAALDAGDAQALATETAIDDVLEEPAAPDGLAGVEGDALAGLIAAIERGKDELGINEPAPAATPARAIQGVKDCSVCPEMVALSGGSFQIGAPVGEAARQETEGPMAFVAIQRPFAISASEITFAQWDACVADGGCAYRPADSGWGRADRPVINVSFADATSYTRWLSAKTGNTYRLPSEAEWEFAARAGNAGPLSINGALSPTVANYNGNYPFAGPRGEFRERTTPVASFAPNAYGLFDMHGNVWEWTSDCWAASHAGNPGDGSPRSGECSSRVLKGGAWNTGGWRLRSAHRIEKRAAARENDIGFRVVRGE
ncbi:MAG: SUMF1/EgtB/PvdO family nonheme iron enzyme [Marinicaulis sp.]|nr:SUMF1/EgtB/PvdO family nonheme iron enzyme [Marinicaulis sp.]NNE41608.1 SUMF1/EgtB/PvdO family nonheme iron enzyme [Marinicaulis sp.]